MWEVEYYETQNGECPTEEFLDGLSPSVDLPSVMNDLGRLEQFGNMLRRPQAENLGHGIYELRTETMSGQIRLLYFFFYQEKIIISHGIRKEQKVPPEEIKRAVEHKKDYLSRHQRKVEPKTLGKNSKGQGQRKRRQK